MCEFEVFVSKEDFKFNCAHFIAYKGFRERLHGHNYRVSVRVTGSDFINDDGYVLDFGDIKKVARKLCKSLNEYFICPTKSTDIVISEVDGQVCLECEDGSQFSFPRSDCAMLPIVHSSAEELAHWFWCCMVRCVRLVGTANTMYPNSSNNTVYHSLTTSHAPTGTLASRSSVREA